MQRLSLKAAPTDLAVDEQLVREHLRVDDALEGYLIKRYIVTATAYLDGWTGILGRALMPQVWTMVLGAFPADCIRIPMGPVTSIVSVKYKDENGVLQTLSSSEYEVALGTTSAEIRAPAGWPEVGDYLDPVEIEFGAGSGCPEPVAMAIMMMVSAIYEGRQGDAMLTPAVRALIAPYRLVGV